MLLWGGNPCQEDRLGHCEMFFVTCMNRIPNHRDVFFLVVCPKLCGLSAGTPFLITKIFKYVGVRAYLSVRLCFHSSASSPFTQIEACVTPICDSSVCVFPPLFVLAGSCNQQHFCILKMGFWG